MTPYSNDVFPIKRLTQAVAMALATLVASGPAAAQQTAPAATSTAGTATAAAGSEAAAEGVQQVLVIGARESQRSAIARKKRADTAQDSIVAEDVGAFPDRNVADAISRVAGVAVDRGDFGEGISVSIRGNGPELTRVELDGQGVQQAGGADMLGGITAGADTSGGRSVEMRQLSSDLIKSVDVIKGSTADMTEGSLGGGVKITTRSGLDFKKDYLSVRVAGQQNSLNKKVNPNLNLVGVKKFMDGRLGVLVNVSKSSVNQEAHKIDQGGTNSQVGQTRPMDFDNSPEKTVALRPDTLNLNDAASTTPFYTSPYSNTALGSWVSMTPKDVLEGSAAAKTKAECYQKFPILPAATAALIGTGNNGRTNAQNITLQALQSCLGQWNDWVPNNTRYFVNRWNDDRVSGDIRLDFKVNDNLTVYAKHSRSKGDVVSYSTNMNYGSPGVSAANNAFVRGPNGFNGGPSIDTTAVQPNGTGGVRTANPASGYFLYPNELTYRSGSTSGSVITTPGLNGAVSNINPGSVVVDANHHLTSFQISDGLFGVDNTTITTGTKSSYTQAGGTFKKGILRAEFMLGDSKSDFYRYEKRLSQSAYLGPTTAKVLPNGIWNYTPDNSVDLSNPNNWLSLAQSAGVAASAASATAPASPAYTGAQLPLTGNSTNLLFQNPRINESYEKTAKLDLIIATDEYIPFVPSIKVGYNRRKSGYDAWNTGGPTIQDPVGTFGTAGYTPGIYLSTNNLRSNFQVCQDTPGSLAPGGRPCQYGYTPSTNPSNSRQGTIVLTPEQYRDFFQQSYTKQPTAQFYEGDPDRPAGLINGWTEFDIDKAYSILGVQNYNLDCIKSCVGSDGKVYDQPKNSIMEQVDAGYVMTNFEVDRLPFTQRAFPFGVSFDGNLGVRAVKTKVVGSGQLTFRSIVPTASYNPLDRNNAAGISTRIYRRETAINATTTDYLPSLNFNTWIIPDKLVLRYNWGKTIGRPPGGRLIPNGTCEYDGRGTVEADEDGTEGDALTRCTDIMGNPELKPLTNYNRNLSLEWYANKDIMVSGSIYEQKGIIGFPNLIETLDEVYPFAGSNAIDPQTGTSLADLPFAMRRWTNQLPFTRKGFEVSTKLGFTALPWYLRYTGLDANYTRNKSSLEGAAMRDLITGDILPVAGEPRHSWNASVWYDDGALSMRVGLQIKASTFSCTSGCNGSSINNYPAVGMTTVRFPPYFPGTPVFRLDTRYVDAKIAYKFKNGVELFAEARNLGKIHTGSDTGGYSQFADGTPNVYNDTFAGATYMAGVNFKFGGQ
ncbi:TonB-dependent receptor [Massilia niabensis]|uniref:TonB-dependent receptor n=1 Tax=Massilia niabensis TaxID=544910 RepID=A0ABW0KZB0_9BURK